jgi:hypothetical protein
MLHVCGEPNSAVAGLSSITILAGISHLVYPEGVM